MRPGIGFLKVNTTKMNSLEGLKVDVNVDEARWSVSKSMNTLQEINAALQSNPLMAKVFPPEVMLEYMNLGFSVKEKARQRMKQLEEMQMQLEQSKAQKPPSLSADLGDIDKLPPEGQAQLAAMFGIQLDPNQIVDKDAQKSQMDLQITAQKAQLDLETKAKMAEIDEQGKVIDLQAKMVQNSIDAQSKNQKLDFDKQSFMQKMRQNQDAEGL